MNTDAKRAAGKIVNEGGRMISGPSQHPVDEPVAPEKREPGAAKTKAEPMPLTLKLPKGS